jgi:virginiamycin B lyase
LGVSPYPARLLNSPLNPDPEDLDGGPAIGPDKNIWFTEESCISTVGCSGSWVERFTPAGQITQFPLSNPNTGPIGITTGPDGNLSFTEDPINDNASGAHIGRITPSGQITEFPVPNLSNDATNITAGPDGNLWFTACTYDPNALKCTNNQIGRITSGK